MKKILMLSIAFLLSLNMMGQDLKKSEIFTSEKKNGFSYDPTIVGEDDNSFYVTAYENKKYWLEKFDKRSLKREFRSEIPIEESIEGSNKEADLSEIIFTGDKFLVFYEYHLKIARKNHDYTLYVKSFDLENGKLIDEKELIQINEIEKKRKRGRFEIIQSEDLSRVLLVHSAYYKSAKRVLRKIILLDSDLRVLHEAEDTDSEYEEGIEIPSSSIIDNNGTIYSLVYVYSSKRFKLLFFDPNDEYERNEEFVNLDIESDVLASVNSVSLNVNAKNELTFTGLYSIPKELRKKNGKTKTRVSLEGAFYVSLDPSNHSVIQNRVFHFDQSFLDQFRSEKDIDKGRDAQVNNSFKNIKILDAPDGGIYAICEKYLHTYQYDQNGSLAGEHIHYGDILSMHFDSQGELLWSNRIPKHQLFYWSSVNGLIFSSAGFRIIAIPNSWLSTRHYSFYAGVHEGELVLLFNDTPKNIPQQNNVNAKLKPLKKPKKAVVKEFTIDVETGETKASTNFDVTSYNVILRPDVGYQKEEDGPVYLFGHKSKSYQYFKYQP